VTTEEFLKKYDQLEAARAEYLERMRALDSLSGGDFELESLELSDWVNEINEQLNDFARSELGEALAIDAESLHMLVMSRGGQSDP